MELEANDLSVNSCFILLSGESTTCALHSTEGGPAAGFSCALGGSGFGSILGAGVSALGSTAFGFALGAGFSALAGAAFASGFASALEVGFSALGGSGFASALGAGFSVLDGSGFVSALEEGFSALLGSVFTSALGAGFFSGSSTVLSRTTGAAFAPFSVFAVGSSFVIFVCSFHCRRAGYHRCSKRMERFGVFCKNIRRRTAPYPPPENTDRGRCYHSSTSISPVPAW